MQPSNHPPPAAQNPPVIRHRDLPWAHVFAGLFLLIEGIWAALRTIAFLLAGYVNLDFAILLIPLSLRVLRLQEAWRRVAVILISLRVCMLTGMLILPLFQKWIGHPPFSLQDTFADEQDLYRRMLRLLLDLWILRTFLRADIRKIFQKHRKIILSEPRKTEI